MNWFDVTAFLLVCAVFVPLERIFALHPAQKIFRRAWQTDLAHLFATGVIVKLGLTAIAGLILVASHRLVPGSIRAAVASQPLALQFGELLVLADLGFYAAHRAFHAIPALWKFHAVHHSIEELDWLAASRVHPVDQIVTKGLSLLPVFALGFAAEAILLYAGLYQWQSVLIHSNTRIGFGPLRRIIASPRFHHWHHANCPDAVDKNFGGQLVLFDLLFGTLHMPGDRMPERYGTDAPVPPSYLAQLVYPLAAGADQVSKDDMTDGRR